MTQSNKIELALTAWRWLADLNNSEPQPPLVDYRADRELSDPLIVGDAAVPMDSRRFSPGILHKKVFGKKTRAEVDEILNLLEIVGVVGSSFHDGTAGRPRELRNFLPGLLRETELTDMLTKAMSASPVKDHAPETNVTNEIALQIDSHEQEIKATAEITLKVYDWLSDPENTELGSYNAEVFSIKRLSREIDNAAEGLRILEYRQIISKPFDEPNTRGRKMAKLNQDWFKPGGKERLVQLLTPAKPEPYVKCGPLRVLNECMVFRPGSGGKLPAGLIVTDEDFCSFLLHGGFPVAPMQETDACMCPVTSCRLKFKTSDYAPLDHPVLIVRQPFYFYFNQTQIRFKRDDVVSRWDLVKFLTAGKEHWPVVVAAPSEIAICPKCRHVSRRTVMLGDLAAAS